jgi:hypothetical protein
MIFADEEGVPRGIPKLWRLYLLDISWGEMGIPKLELLSILHLISSLSYPYTWKLPSYKTSHNSISNISVSMISTNNIARGMVRGSQVRFQST